jgi:uncharacterized protein (DUF885 family)
MSLMPLVLLVVAALPQVSSGTEVTEVGDAYLRLVAAQDPRLSLGLGYAVKDLPDLSQGQEEKDAAQAKLLLARLDAVSPSDLSHDQALSLDILKRRLQAIEESPKFRFLRFPVTPYASPIGPVAAFFEALPLENAAETANYLRLLKRYPAFLGSIKGVLDQGLGHGTVLSSSELDKSIAFVTSYAEASPSPFEPKPGRLAKLSPAEADAFRKELQGVIKKDVNPAFERLAKFLSGEYKSWSPDAVGLSQYTGGGEYYAWLVRLHTTMNVTPQQVHERGLAEVARVEAEMMKVRQELGYKGPASTFRDSLRKDPRFFPKTPEEIEERLMAHVHRIEPRIDEYFLRKPKAPYGVRRLAPELEAGETFGHYAPPLPGETGYYFFNGSRLEERSLLNAAALIYHELVPGHHFQINLAAENEGLPPFRRNLTDTAYTEGWGEYSSILAGEMGMYADPYDHYGRLAMDMFLSTRLVVDTGMNALGWSREKAVEYMRDHLMETDVQIASESLRYSCDIPGQALAYKMGANRILELRETARAALGSRFDIRRFHDAVLSPGSLPMATLEGHIRWFVEQEKKQ